MHGQNALQQGRSSVVPRRQGVSSGSWPGLPRWLVRAGGPALRPRGAVLAAGAYSAAISLAGSTPVLSAPATRSAGLGTPTGPSTLDGGELGCGTLLMNAIVSEEVGRVVPRARAWRGRIDNGGAPGGRPTRRRSVNTVINLAQTAASLTELWSPRVVAEVDDAFVKVAKVHGTFAWHAHDDEDELFFILQGRLRIELESVTLPQSSSVAGAGGVGTTCVTLESGDLFVVPKGVRHRPIAEEECHLMLFERKSTLHTGREITDFTRSLTDQLRPVDPSGAD